MSVALAMAVRIQSAIVEIAALKARTAHDIEVEERLQERMASVMARLVDHVDRGVRARGRLPGDTSGAVLLLGPLDDIGEELLEVLTDEVGDEALAAIEHVEEAVAQARKSLPDGLRPFGMDRRLFDTMSGLRDRMLGRFVSRTTDALVAASDVDLPVGQLRDRLGEMLEGELQQLSRHALGDARNEATEQAERDLGVEWHRWVTAGDDQVRPAHAEVDGEIQKVGERFSNGWRRPGGVGCRCRLEPVVVRPLEEQPLPPGWTRDDAGQIVRSS